MKNLPYLLLFVLTLNAQAHTLESIPAGTLHDLLHVLPLLLILIFAGGLFWHFRRKSN